ncbi:MAG: peptidoglycan-binding domain-containing protein [Candidatus Paceibacterota bacterium]
MKHKILGFLIVFSLLFVLTPTTTKASTIDDVMAQVVSLQEKILDVQNQMSALVLRSPVGTITITPTTTTPTTVTTPITTTSTTTTSNLATQALVSASPIAVFNRTLRMGIKGNDVTALQTILKNKGYLSITVSIDGSFGLKTASALMEYQKSKGLKADGIAGLNTLNELIKDNSDSSLKAASAEGCSSGQEFKFDLLKNSTIPHEIRLDGNHLIVRVSLGKTETEAKQALDELSKAIYGVSKIKDSNGLKSSISSAYSELKSIGFINKETNEIVDADGTPVLGKESGESGSYPHCKGGCKKKKMPSICAWGICFSFWYNPTPPGPPNGGKIGSISSDTCYLEGKIVEAEFPLQ